MMLRGRPRSPISKHGEGRIDLKKGKWYAYSPRVGFLKSERLCRGQDYKHQAEKILKEWLENNKEEIERALSNK